MAPFQARVSKTNFLKLASSGQWVLGREGGCLYCRLKFNLYLGTVCFIWFWVKGGRCQARLSPFQLLFLKKDKEKRKTKQPNTRSPRPCCAVGGLHELPLSNHKKASVEPARGPGTAFPRPARSSVEVSSYPGARSHSGKQPMPLVTQRRGPYLPVPLSVCRHCVVLRPQPRLARGR